MSPFSVCWLESTHYIARVPGRVDICDARANSDPVESLRDHPSALRMPYGWDSGITVRAVQCGPRSPSHTGTTREADGAAEGDVNAASPTPRRSHPLIAPSGRFAPCLSYTTR